MKMTVENNWDETVAPMLDNIYRWYLKEVDPDAPRPYDDDKETWLKYLTAITLKTKHNDQGESTRD